MATIADLIGQSVQKQCADAALYMQIAQALSMTVDRVKTLVAKYGAGYIYTNTGFVVPDRPRQRFNMVNTYGTCVIIAQNGRVIVKTPESIGSVNRRLQAKKDKRERGILRNEIKRHRLDKCRERQFRDCQTQASPKHQGKANSHADIGKYVYCPATTYRPKMAETVFAVIAVHSLDMYER